MTITAVETCDDESPAAFLARLGTDGQVWAREFVARHGGDEGLMLSWFANAIEAGRSAGLRRGHATAARA